jgi:hypothetical protein
VYARRARGVLSTTATKNDKENKEKKKNYKENKQKTKNDKTK